MKYKNKNTSEVISESDYEKLSDVEKKNYEEKASDDGFDNSTNNVPLDCAMASSIFISGIF